MLKNNLMRDPVGCLKSGGLSYSSGLNMLVGYLYSGGLSLFWWAIFVLLGCIFWWVIFILVGHQYCLHFAQHSSICLFN